MKFASLFLRSANALPLLVATGWVAGCQSVVEPPRTAREFSPPRHGASSDVSKSAVGFEHTAASASAVTARRLEQLESRIAATEARARHAAEEATASNETLRQRAAATAGDLAQLTNAFRGLGPIAPGWLFSGQTLLGATAASAGADAGARAEKQISALKAEIQAKEEFRRNERQLARREIANLDAQHQAALRREFLAEARQRASERAAGMPLEQLVATLGAAALSVAAFLRTFGREHSGEIDRLPEKPADLKMPVAENSVVLAAQRVS